jgi:hypothetical protein
LDGVGEGRVPRGDYWEFHGEWFFFLTVGVDIFICWSIKDMDTGVDTSETGMDLIDIGADNIGEVTGDTLRKGDKNGLDCGDADIHDAMIEMHRLSQMSAIMHDKVDNLTNLCSLLRLNLHMACEKLVSLGYKDACQLERVLDTEIPPYTLTPLKITPRHSAPHSALRTPTIMSCPPSPAKVFLDEDGSDIVASAQTLIRSISARRGCTPNAETPSPVYFSFSPQKALEYGEDMEIYGGGPQLSASDKRFKTCEEELQRKNKKVKEVEQENKRLLAALANCETSATSLKKLLALEKEKTSKLECDIHTLAGVALKQLCMSKAKKPCAEGPT